MREIKFRGWDTKKEMMALNLHTEYDTIRDVEYTNGEEPCLSCFNDYLKSDEWIVMQYTGLKDKNGVEIYEGDVVKAVAAKNADENVTNDVIFNTKGGWEVRVRSKYEITFFHGLPIEWGGWESIEVIGNIYQNPELIK